MKYGIFLKTFILCILVQYCLLAREVVSLDNNSSVNKKYTISFGINYSNFSTTDGIGKIGLKLEGYKIKRINRFLILQYGIGYANKKVTQLDKKIRSDPPDDSDLITSDIHNNFHFLTLNGLIKLKVLKKDNMSFNMIAGIGYSINIYCQTKIDWKSQKYIGYPFNEEYDYQFAFEGGAPIFNNSGWVYHIGCGFGLKKYNLDVLFTHHKNGIEQAKSLLYINEGLYSISILFGVNI